MDTRRGKITMLSQEMSKAHVTYCSKEFKAKVKHSATNSGVGKIWYYNKQKLHRNYPDILTIKSIILINLSFVRSTKMSINY